MSNSEIAQIRERIEQEVMAARRAMYGYATVSRHEIISHHFEMLGACLTELTGQVGEQAAIATIIEVLEEHI